MKKKALIGVLILILLIGMSYIVYKVMNSRTFQLMGEIIQKADTEEKVVAITFDDGPTDNTDSILKILNDADIKATFFLTGKSIEENPEETKKIVTAGHELGNHTYSHKRMVFKSPSFIKEEINKTDKLIREAGYKGEIHFRPPNGKKLVFLPYYLNKKDKKTIMWNIEPDSYPEIAKDKDKIVKFINDNIEPGSIILLHVMYDTEERKSLESIKDIILNLKEKGYEFKTVSDLLKYSDK
ncbi:polysaccharide deacetylase family protein [Sporosalibacterium faouarense]|uniref:polysaccharide deacetylase family protein n=1 Tax=Sporosalibacterium faouarense TaxID=516123 RepID=UPI00192B481D|nr:polysaccharide deacetylase family protein [Sporosalibacterium faouarense]